MDIISGASNSFGALSKEALLPKVFPAVVDRKIQRTVQKPLELAVVQVDELGESKDRKKKQREQAKRDLARLEQNVKRVAEKYLSGKKIGPAVRRARVWLRN